MDDPKICIRFKYTNVHAQYKHSRQNEGQLSEIIIDSGNCES